MTTAIVPAAPVCGAQLRGRPGRYCKKAPLAGRTRCEFHGGKSLRGVASPSFKHGKYSRNLPEAFAAQYEEARTSPDLVQMRDELAVTQVLLGDALASLKDGSSEWQRMIDAVDDLRDAMRSRDQGKIAAAITKVCEESAGGRATLETLQKIDGLIHTRRKLVDTETKRMKALSQVMSNDQAMTLVGALSAAIMEEVPDKAVQARINARFQLLLTAKKGVGK